MAGRPIPWAEILHSDVEQARKQIVSKITVFAIYVMILGGTLSSIYFCSIGRELDPGRFSIVLCFSVIVVGILTMQSSGYLQKNVQGLTCVFFLDDTVGKPRSHLSCNHGLAQGKVHFRFPLSGWGQQAVVVDRDGEVIKFLRLRFNQKHHLWILSDRDGCNAISDSTVSVLLSVLQQCGQSIGLLPEMLLHRGEEIHRLEAKLAETISENKTTLLDLRKELEETRDCLDLLGRNCVEAVVVSGRKRLKVEKKPAIGSHAGHFAAWLLTATPEHLTAQWFEDAEQARQRELKALVRETRSRTVRTGPS